AIGGTPAKKQAAVSSLLFSAGTGTVVVILLPLLNWVILDLFAFADNPVLGIALFHTLFNVTGVLIFFPLIPLMAGRLERFFIERKPVLTRYIINTAPEVPDAAIAALRKEILHQLHLSILYITGKYKIGRQTRLRTSRHEKVPDQAGFEKPVTYQDLEQLHAEIFAFYARVQAQPLDETETMHIEPLMRASRSIMNATLNLSDLLGEITDIGNEEKAFMVTMHKDFMTRLAAMKTRVETTMAAAAGPPDLEPEQDIQGLLSNYFFTVEEEDKQFIRACSKAIARKAIKETDVSRLLMANRLFTQSCRMIVLSMQGLTRKPDPANPSSTLS
ncbi:MAG: hypothetical protein ACNA7H_06665, partial [Desulfotignum sp.]